MPTIGPVDECVAAYQRVDGRPGDRPGHRPDPPRHGPRRAHGLAVPGRAHPRRRARRGSCWPPRTPTGVNPHPRLTLDAAGHQLGPHAPSSRWPARPRPRRSPRWSGATTCRPPGSTPGTDRVAGRRRRPRRRPLDWPRCSPTPISSALPLRRPDGAGPGRARRRARPPGHLLAQGLHPADHAVPRPLRLLHLRQGAGPGDRALPDARRGAGASPGPGATPGATRRSSPWASGPSCATRWRADWLAGAGVRLDGRLPRARCAASSWRRPACSPTPTPARSTADELATSAPGVGQPGHDARVAGRGPGGAPRRARQGAGPAAGHPGGGRRARHPLHDRDPGRHRRRPGRPAGRPAGHRRVARPPRARARGHRAELPAQAGHGHGAGPSRARPRTCSGPSRRPASCCRPRSTCRRRPTSPTSWPRCSTPASTTGAACRPSRPTT